jgi:beta-carotene ketolase (CrtO type)
MTRPNADVDVVVVGGGHNGLTCAAYLARAGVDVIVVEQNKLPGGALMSSEWQGHVLEHGAVEHTAVLASGVIDELGLEELGLEYRTREVAAVHLFGDGTTVTIGRTVEATAESIAPISTRDARAWTELSERSAPLLRAFAIASRGWIPPMRVATRIARTLGGRNADTLVELVQMSVLDLAVRWFESPHMRALAIFRASFLGMPPWAPGTANAFLLTTGGHGRRLGRPLGGSRAFVSALTSAVTTAGGAVRCGFRVESVDRLGAGWTGRSTTGEQVTARRAVVSAIPPQDFVLQMLSPPDVVPASIRRRLGSVEVVGSNVSQLTIAAALDSSACVPTFGDPDSDQAMLWLLAEPRAAIDTYSAISLGLVPPAPGTLVAFPTSVDPGLAPAGRATMWANAVAPRDVRGRTWEDAASEAADGVWRTIDACLPGVRPRVVHEVLTNPHDLTAATGAGNPGNHVAPSTAQSLGTRPTRGMGNYSTPIEGIFVTGAGTHPGGGINGSSGRACAQAVLRSIGTHRIMRRLGRAASVARQLTGSIAAARDLRAVADRDRDPDPPD